MRTPDKQLLPLIALTVLLAQGISTQTAFAVANWSDPGGKGPEIAGAAVPGDSTSRVWEELSRMSSGFKGRNLIAGSQTEGDAASRVANEDSAKTADASEKTDDAGARTDDAGARADDASARAADAAKNSDSAASKEVLSSLKGLTPTESYLKCREALLKAKSIAEVIPYLSRASGAEASSDLAKSPEDAKGKLELLQLMMPPQVKVTSEKISGSTAVLTAIPLAPSGMDEGMSQLMNGMAQGLANAMGSKEKLPPTKTETAGSIYMTLEDGVWKQDKEKWNSQIKEASGN